MNQLNFYLKAAMAKDKLASLKNDDFKKYQQYMQKPLPLILYCSQFGKRIQLPLGISIPPLAWDGNRIKSTKDCSQWVKHNETLIEVEGKLFQYFASKENSKENFTKVILQKIIKGTSPVVEKSIPEKIQENNCMLTLFKECMKDKKTKQGFPFSKNTKKNYKANFNHLQKFIAQQQSTIMIEEVDKVFVENYIEYLYNCGSNDNTVAKYFKNLKAVLNYYDDKGFKINHSVLKMTKSEYEPPVIYLELSELVKIAEYKFDEPKLSEARDFLIFMAFTGQRYSDYTVIKRDDLTELNGRKVWILTSEKTKQNITVPLTEYAIEIIEHYKDGQNVLPRFSSNTFNKSLKEMAKLVGLDRIVHLENRIKGQVFAIKKPLHEVLSSHMARKSFITNSLILGFREYETKTISGHKSERSFRRYVNVLNSVLKKAPSLFSKDNINKMVETMSN